MNKVLSKPLTLPCGAILPNRICKAALSEGLADASQRPDERLFRLYGKWSDGGAGLLITGNVQIDGSHLERPGNLVVEQGQSSGFFEKLAAAGSQNGNHLWMQLNHPGRQTSRHLNPEPIAPSAVPMLVHKDYYAPPRAATSEDIYAIIDGFRQGALFAKNRGFSGVQIHAAHGYLISQFLSPITNRRNDEWGGPLDHRARLLVEIVGVVRKAVGTDFPVSVKLNSSDFQKGGFSDEDAVQVARWLDAAGIDLLELSGGNYERPSMSGAQQDWSGRGEQQSTMLREVYFLSYAKLIKSVVKMPVMVTGGFRSPSSMVQALEGRAVDLIGLGRPLCTQPDFPRFLLQNDYGATLSFGAEIVISEELKRSEQVRITTEHAWYCVQLIRLADGLQPDLAMSGPDAMKQLESHEAAAIARLHQNKVQ